MLLLFFKTQGNIYIDVNGVTRCQWCSSTLFLGILTLWQNLLWFILMI